MERSRAAAAGLLPRLGLSQFATGLALKRRNSGRDHAANLRHKNLTDQIYALRWMTENSSGANKTSAKTGAPERFWPGRGQSKLPQPHPD